MAGVSPPQDCGNSAPLGNAQASGCHGLNHAASFFLSNYRLGKTLGIGSFGKVKVAEHVQTGHKVAVKILNRKKMQAQGMEEKVRREVKILQLFMHPHITRLYEIIETPTDIYLVMEYAPSGELFDHIVEKGRLLEDEARYFFQQIISGVDYCHRHMVVHRDLKPENILLDAKMNVKIADFGLSNIMREGHFLSTSCGSPNYAAPEVLSGKLYAGPEVDVWSCGVILYALLCGSLPFDDDYPVMFKKIKAGIYSIPSYVPPGARDLIPRMLTVDPLSRITVAEIYQHPWFTWALPKYLLFLQGDTLSSVPRIDEATVDEAVRLGANREVLVESLKKRLQNQCTVIYHLLMDSRQGPASSRSLRSELSSACCLPAPSGPPSSDIRPHCGLNTMQAQVHDPQWRLGVRSRGPAATVMMEMLRVLQANQVSWKRLGPYTLRCRVLVSFGPRRLPRPAHMLGFPLGPDGSCNWGMSQRDSPTGGLSVTVKFETQLYKITEGEYVIDLQRVEGEQYAFMDVCGRVLSDLTCW